jgi:hypothetical protein
MLLRLAAFAALILLVLAVPAAAQAADTVRPSAVSGSASVPAGGSRGLTLRCPGTSVALNAAVTRQGPGTTVRRSAPGDDAGSWRFRLRNDADGARRVEATLRCVRLEVPSGVSGAGLMVSTRRPPAFTIPPGGSSSVDVRCARGWLPTGYGVGAGADAADVKVAFAFPDAREWSFTLENTGSDPALASVSVRCLRRIVSARRGGSPTELRFLLDHPFFTNSVGPGARAFSHSCSSRQFALATGVVLDPADDIVMRDSHPAGARRGVWSFRQPSGTEEVDSKLVCLGLSPRFR